MTAGWHILAGVDELLQRRMVTHTDRNRWISHLCLGLRWAYLHPTLTITLPSLLWRWHNM